MKSENEEKKFKILRASHFTHRLKYESVYFLFSACQLIRLPAYSENKILNYLRTSPISDLMRLIEYGFSDTKFHKAGGRDPSVL